MGPMLAIRGLGKSFGGARPREVLRDISLEVARGEYVAIVGESGVGKSTLLNLIAGLDLPDRGSIALDGTDLTALDDAARTLLRRDRIGFVFQAFHLLPHLTVAQNVALPLSLDGVAPRAVAERVGEMLAAVGSRGSRRQLPARARRAARCSASPSHARWCTGRCCCSPTSRPATSTRRPRRRCWRLLREQVKRESGAGILVTHSALAAATADRVLVLTADGLHPAASDMINLDQIVN